MERFALRHGLGELPFCTAYFLQDSTTTTGPRWDGFEEAHPRLLLDALGKCFFDFSGVASTTLKPASVGLFPAVSAGSASRAFRISLPLEAQLLEAKANLLRLRQDISLADTELAAVEDGLAAYEELPTPAGPTPRQLGRRAPRA